MKQCPHCGRIFVREDLERCPHDDDLLDQLAPFEHISNAKYIFLDVVGFTRDRSIEAQSDIVYVLNEIVRNSVDDAGLPEDRVIYIPTGDGLCIALLDVESPYDIHLMIALDILSRLQEHNDKAQKDTRKFQIRIGLNAHLDNLVIDINGHRNMAGAGISLASRIMSLADGNQILVGQSVYEMLRYRERYSNSFKAYLGKVKHGISIAAFQFIENGHQGLNIDMPQAFQTIQPTEPKLSLRVACYFAHAIKNREALLQEKNAHRTTAKSLLLWMLAGDTVFEIEAKGLTGYPRHTYKAGDTLEEQLEFYSNIDFYTLLEIDALIYRGKLYDYHNYFEGGHNWLINSKGKEKLRQEWPDIWDKFGLEAPASN